MWLFLFGKKKMFVALLHILRAQPINFTSIYYPLIEVVHPVALCSVSSSSLFVLVPPPMILNIGLPLLCNVTTSQVVELIGSNFLSLGGRTPSGSIVAPGIVTLSVDLLECTSTIIENNIVK